MKGNKKPQNMTEAQKSRESLYYYVRSLYNKEPVGTYTRSAMFIFLNKTCFRGMHRVGPNGFNVPFGHYKNPSIDEKCIMNVSKLIQDVKFKCMDFKKSLKKPKEGDFVYLDPPYVKETETSFTGYNKGGFGHENHKKLFRLTKKISKRRSKIPNE